MFFTLCVVCGLFLICSVFHFVCCLGFTVSWATPLVGLWRLLACGVNIRVICVICGLFLICSVFHFVCCLGFTVSWATPLVGLWRLLTFWRCYLCIFLVNQAASRLGVVSG